MFFESKTCLHVSLIPKHQLHEKKVLYFSKWRTFSNSLLFLGKTAFLQTSVDFETGFEKFLSHLKALLTWMQTDLNNFFVAQVVPEIYAKTTTFKNSQMCFLLLTVILKFSNGVENIQLSFGAICNWLFVAQLPVKQRYLSY